MITARHLVPGRVLRAVTLVHVPSRWDGWPSEQVEDRVHCMVIGTEAPRRRHARKNQRNTVPTGLEGWRVVVVWLDERCNPRIEEIHVPAQNDWEVAW